MNRYTLLFAATVFVCASTPAATCRSQAAAAAGREIGYSRDETAAKRVEQKESQSSDAVGRCVTGITNILVMPTFPSLTDIFTTAVDRVCTVAIDRIRDGLPPAPAVPGQGGVPNPTVPPWPALPLPPARPIAPPAPATTATAGTGPSSGAAASSDFWRAIWR